MARKKVIIEARVNEYAMRDGNPNVPWSPDEIAVDAAACRAAGASIVHYHARRDDGSPCHDISRYAACIRAIRSRTDALIHPTIGQIAVSGDEARIAPIEAMARDPATRPDLAPLDMGSTNLDAYDAKSKRFRTDQKVYANSIRSLTFLAQRLRAAGVKPYLSVWTVPCVRTIEAFLDSGLISEPALVAFVLTEGGLLGGHPGTVRGLESLVHFLPADRRIEWLVVCKEGNLLPIAAAALALGGHISIGLGDYPYPELGSPTNSDVVREVVRLAQAAGREPATPADVRSMLSMV